MSMPRATSALVGHSGRQPLSRNRLARRFLVTVDACLERYNCCIGDGSVVQACATAARLHKQRFCGKWKEARRCYKRASTHLTIATRSLNHQAHAVRLQRDRLIKGRDAFSSALRVGFSDGTKSAYACTLLECYQSVC